MTFTQNVERWRDTVNRAVAAVLASYPSNKSLLDALGLTITGLADVILALIQKESSGNPLASGDNGKSIGLMQLNYGAGVPQDYGYSGTPEGLDDPYTNVVLGIRHFLYQLGRYSDLDKAILAYNAGSYRLTAAGIPINLPYLNDVLSFLGKKNSRDFLASLSLPLEHILSGGESAAITLGDTEQRVEEGAGLIAGVLNFFKSLFA